MMYGWYGNGWGAGSWIGMIVTALIFCAAVVAFIVWIVRQSPGRQIGSPPPAPHSSAEQILNERFARGEIDETEFLARRSALRRQD